MNADLKSQRISDLLDRIGRSDLYRQFSSDLIQRINPGNSLLYDITSLPSYGSSEILEYGHAKDHPELEQINMGMVMERSRNIPLFFEIYSGSIPDVVTLKRTVEGIRKLIPKMEKLHVVEDASGSINELERTRKQKDILEALEKVSWW